MNDKIEKVMNEWNEYRQDALDRHDPNSEKGTNEMRILLQTSVWMDRLYRATINGETKKKRPGRKPGPQPKTAKKTVKKKRKRRTKEEMAAARAADKPTGPQMIG